MHQIALHLLRVNRACRDWKPFLCALILAVVLLTGDWDWPVADLAGKSAFRGYNDLVCLIDRAMLNSRILAESDCEWHLRAFGAGGKPFSSPRVLEIFSHTGIIALAADEAGRISFPVRADLRRENPPVRFPEFSRGIQTLIIETPRFSRLTTKCPSLSLIFSSRTT